MLVSGPGLLVDAIEQVGLGVEPGVERAAVLRHEGHDVIGLAAVGLLRTGADLRAAEIRAPPQIGVAIGFVDRQCSCRRRSAA